jgi:hypothetical protein
MLKKRTMTNALVIEKTQPMKSLLKSGQFNAVEVPHRNNDLDDVL